MNPVSNKNAEHAVQMLLKYIGEDPYREGLQDTPKRFLKAWKEYWGKGYDQDPAKVLKVFEDGAENYDGMVIVKDIDFYSHCEHHIAPIIGKCHIAYIPDEKIVGLSKLARLVDVFARRLQVQERLTAQIATALQEVLSPKGVAVVIEAEHLCMSSRGVQRKGSITVTSKLTGAFLDELETREEFMKLIGGKNG